MIDLHIIAVRQENPLAGELHDPGRGIDLHSALRFEIVPDPHVVITRHENHPNPPVGQFAQLSQYTHKPFGDNPFVFEPEIEKVAQNKNRLGIAGNLVEPRHETFLDRTGRSRLPGPQMNVRCEIIHIIRIVLRAPAANPHRKGRGPLRYPCGQSENSKAAFARYKVPAQENCCRGSHKPKSREAAVPARR